MQCLQVLSGSMTECPLYRRGVCLWEVKNAVFLLSGSMTECLLIGEVSAYERFKMQCFQAKVHCNVWEHD